MAAFGPILSLFGGDPNALIRGSINDGTLLLLLEFSEVDDLLNDRHIVVRLMVGTAPTDVGNDGFLVPGQSFDVRPDVAVAEFRGSIVDGHVDAGNFEFVLPISILQGAFDLPLLQGRLSVDIDPSTGEVQGVIGAGVSVAAAVDAIANEIEGANRDTVAVASTFVARSADLRSAGGADCDMISAALAVRGVQAFILEDPL